jgi:TolB-like protein/tetratricopeptide (TPR) repeat protein
VTEASHAVFLSYASQDAEAAQKICEALRAAGIEVWFDQSELRGGDAWDQKIRQEIRDCALLVAIISQHTQERLEGYFRHEWNLAIERAHHIARQKPFLIPVVVDGTGDREALVPDEFRAVQWTRLAGKDTTPAFVARVVALLGTAVPVAATAGADPKPVSSSTATRNRRAFWVSLGFGALAIIVAGAWIAFQHSGLRRQAQADATGEAKSAVSEKSLAVLPFVDLSEKHDTEYFGDGLAEELIDLLTRVPNLAVVARTSSFQFKGKSVPISQIGKQLHVAYVLEGSVRQTDLKLRITAQLIRTADERHVWSMTYDRNKEDVFQVQDDIAREVIRALRIVFADVARVRSASTSWEVYQMYLDASLLEWDSGENVNRAIATLRSALALDENFAPAWAALADRLSTQGDMFNVDRTKAYSEARDAALRAIRLDPSLPDGHLAMVYIHEYYDWDWDGAEKSASLAEQLQPGNPRVLQAVADIASLRGDFGTATDLTRRALARDPLSVGTHDALGEALYCEGKFAESAAAFHRSLELDPVGGSTQALLGRSLMMQGHLQEALDIAASEPIERMRLWSTALIQNAMGRSTDSNATLAELQRQFPASEDVSIGWVYAAQGRLDEAFTWFEKGFEHHSRFLTDIKCIPEAPALTRDPRYRSLLHRLNLPE